MAITRLTQSAAAAALTATPAQRLNIIAQAPTAKAEQPKAEYWLNIGYATGDAQYPFVSLPLGVPLDNLEPTLLRGQNQEYLEFAAAKNDLLDAVMEAAGKLQPGDEQIINLQVQIRRTKPADAVAAPNTGKFARPAL